VSPAGFGDGVVDLSHRTAASFVELVAGADNSHRGDVQRSRTRHGSTRAEALALGADGVVGVRLEANTTIGSQCYWFIAVGLRYVATLPARCADPMDNRLRPISRVRNSGCAAIGIRTAGTRIGQFASFISVGEGPFATARSTYRNVELPHVSQAIYQARELAMTRMQTTPSVSTQVALLAWTCRRNHITSVNA